jgi:NAD(P)-dependent dehydrogenase (short-subunit alcohol dehydrogenase family)
MELSGKTAVVTGGGQGLGRAIALVLAARGANVVINGRTKSKLDSVLDELHEQGAQAVAVVADVASRADAQATVQAAEDSFGGVDILVNNAQASVDGVKIVDLDDEVFDLVFRSGARGTLLMMQACFPLMKARGGGAIVNLGSPTSITGDPGFGAYVMTKEAIRGLTRVAASEWGRHNIRINVVCPAALTSSAEEFRAKHPDGFERMLKAVPLGRLGDETDDIAAAVAALVSDDLRFLTGATLVVDGGRVRVP